MSAIDTAAEGYALALEEARRALDEQEREVAGLSARAGILMSAATIATSFLGAPFLRDRQLGPASCIAVGAFVLLSLATLALLSPRREFEFSLGSALVIGRYVEPFLHAATRPRRLRRDLALHMNASAELNRSGIAEMTTLFHISCLLLTTEIVAWVIAIVFGV